MPHYQMIDGEAVELHPMSVLLGFEGDTANLLNPYYGREEQVEGVHAVVVVGLKVPVRELYDSLRGGVPDVYLIGGAAAPAVPQRPEAKCPALFREFPAPRFPFR